MKFITFLALCSSTFGIKLEDHPAPSPLIIDPNWVDYPTANVVRVHEITNPKFNGNAATDFDLSKEPSCPSYMDHYNCNPCCVSLVPPALLVFLLMSTLFFPTSDMTYIPPFSTPTLPILK